MIRVAERPLATGFSEDFGETLAVPRPTPPLGWLATARRGHVQLLFVALALGGGVIVGVLAGAKPKMGLALIVGVALSLVALRRLEWAGLILVSLVPVLSGLRRGWPIPSLRLTEALTAGMAVLVFAFIKRSRALPWTRIEWLLFLYALVSIGLGVYDARAVGASLAFRQIGTLVGPLQFFLLFRTIRLVIRTERLRERALRLLLLWSIPVSLLALAQQANVPKIRTFLYNFTGSDALVGPGSGYQSFARATGPFSHWTPLAGYLSVMLVVGLTLILDPKAQPLRRRTLYAVMVLDLVALAFTAELSAMIGLVIAVVMVGRLTGRLRQVLRVAAICVLGLSIVAGPYVAQRLQRQYSKAAGTNHSSLIPQTIEFRFTIWDQQYLPAIGLRPVTGWGTVTPPGIQWPATESQYITVLERGGAVMMAVYIAMMVGLGTAGMAIARSSDDPLNRVTGYSVATMTVILIPMNFVFPYFEDSGLPQALWALVGIMMAGVPGRLPRLGLSRLRFRMLRLSAPPLPEWDPHVPLGVGDQGLV